MRKTCFDAKRSDIVGVGSSDIFSKGSCKVDIWLSGRDGCVLKTMICGFMLGENFFPKHIVKSFLGPVGSGSLCLDYQF